MKICLILCVILTGLFGNAADKIVPDRGWMIVTHDTNQVEMSISNYGKFGQSGSGTVGCWWPKGSGQNYIFGAGFWFGTIDQGSGDTLVSIGYGPHGGETEFAPGLYGMEPSHPCAIIYINPENYPAPHDTFPMAPQGLVSHEDSWCCYNDCDSTYHMPGDTRPIGIEVYQTGYEWMRTEIQDIFFMTYEFKNVSGHTLSNCHLGIVTDLDIGNEAGTGNDIMAGILKRDYDIGGTVYTADDIAYQWQEVAESGWTPPIPGVIGFDLLQTSFDLVTGQDKDADGIPDQYERDSAYYSQNVPPSQWDADTDYVPDWRDASENPQKGMTALKRFTLNLDPNTDPQRYQTLAGYNFQNGQYEPFDTVPSPPDDQRFLLSSGPVNMPADSAVTFVFAVMLANWHDIYGSPDTALVLVDHWAQRYYDMSWFLYTPIEEVGQRERSITILSIFPNPVHQTGIARFSVLKPGNVTLELYNLAGQSVGTVFSGYKTTGAYDVRFDTRNLSAGTYFAVMRTDNTEYVKSIVILK
jgi:hypothetical protein